MITINAGRLLDDLRALARIGQTPEGGISRPALSAADLEGRAWFRQRILAAGLDFRQDGAGNLSARLGPGDRAILVGSHLDTVPDGGRFDGAVGALSALEALRTIQEAGLNLPVGLEAISFTDEEGAFLGLLGSRALTGALTADQLAQPSQPWDQAQAGMAQLAISPQTMLAAGRDPASYVAFAEVHIEQGARLERAGIDIGVVTGIVGIRNIWLTFRGEAAHAGTMPMRDRADAFWGATAFSERARTLVMDYFSPGVMNCGMIHLAPGAFNIVPGSARLALEFRHGTEADLDAMQAAMFDLAHEVAGGRGLALSIEPAGSVSPARMDGRVMAAVEAAADALRLTHTRLLSFAGHDTQMMSRFVPSAMFFIPSVAGISHNPRELTHEQDVVNGANVLANTILELVGRLT